MSDWRIYNNLLRPILFRIDPEEAHELVHRIALWLKPAMPLLGMATKVQDKELNVSFAGMNFENPVGLAAGFDKNGTLVSILGHLGFGFAEIGSVTARPAAGNTKPRLFRLPEDEALINYMGLNSDGATVVAERLKHEKFSLPVGLNIDKTNDPSVKGNKAVEDIIFTFNRVKHLPIKYVAINASCPNTHERRIQDKQQLSLVLEETQKLNDVNLPIFIKVSPDSSAELLNDIVELARNYRLAGYICVNTSVSRSNLRTSAGDLIRIGAGSLSGKPLKTTALSITKELYRLKEHNQAIIACGGISSGEDVYEFIRAGADAVQIYTALVYHGPFLIAKINRRLLELLQRDRVALQEAIGLDSRRASSARI